MSRKTLLPLFVTCLSVLTVHMLTGRGTFTAILCGIVGVLSIAAGIPAIIKAYKAYKELKKHE